MSITAQQKEFFKTARGLFNKPIVTDALNILSADQIKPEQLRTLVNADSYDYYRYTTGQERKSPVTVSYMRNTILPFIQSGEEIGRLKLFFARSADRQQRLIGQISILQDAEGRIRVSPYALPSERQRGYTKEAYKAVVSVCDNGRLFGSLRQIWAEVAVNNHDSIAFYRSMSFENKGTINTPAFGLQADNQERFVFIRQL